MEPIRFGIVGGGWRSLFYLRIARELPELFQVGGIVIRDAVRGKELETTWGIQTFRTLDELLHVSTPRFLVVSVPRDAAPAILMTCAERRVPVLVETPPAPTLASLIELHKRLPPDARIQVAEQYHLQPLHAARLAVIQSGKLGTVTQAQVSAAHGYHGVSLLRKLLGIRFEPVTITASTFISPLIAGPDRNGPPDREQSKPSRQVIASLDFADKLGIYDFCDDQYFSWIRSPRVLVRGEHGEINNNWVRYLTDFRTPVSFEFVRQNAGEDGNLEGYYHKGILAGNEWVYTNPFAPGHLSDDEIAIASCLAKMDQYVAGGPDFYSLAEASQDHYVNLMIEQALTSSQAVSTTRQLWVQD